ncbi:MAG: hypothetical protein ACJ8GO_07125, partial [Ramlibacter sp.]
ADDGGAAGENESAGGHAWLSRRLLLAWAFFVPQHALQRTMSYPNDRGVPVLVIVLPRAA